MDSIYHQPVRMIPPYRVISRVQILSETQDYNLQLMNVPAMWKQTMGEGVKVVVLDTGLPKHCDLAPKGGKSFIEGYLEDKQGHGCVSSDTLVHTNFCGIETIEKLYERIDAPEQEMVFSDGFKSRVKDIRGMGLKTYALNEETGNTVVAPIEFLHKTPVVGEIVVVNLEGGISYRLTPWHEVCVLVHRHHDVYDVVRKRADEMVSGDRMIFATGDNAGNLVSEPYRVDGLSYRQCQFCGHIPRNHKSRTGKCQCKKCGKNKWDEKRYTYLVTEDLAYLAGIVLTDGHIVNGRNKRVEITSKDKDILKGVLEVSFRLGFGGRIDSPKGRCKRVLIDSKNLVAVMLALGIKDRRKTYEQELPEFVGKSPRSVGAAFIAGVIDGDGCVSKTNTKNRVTTVSRRFAYQFASLLNSFGISCGVQDYGKSSGFGRERKSGANIYNCTFAGLPVDVAERMKCERKKIRAFVSVAYRTKARIVKFVEKEKYDGVFYDFTVKDYHTYLGNGHFVSNTHVAGILAATANNGMGVAGIAPDCELWCGAVLGPDGSGTFESIVNGIRWAVDEVGAKVINMSLGIPTGTPPLAELEKACDYAKSQGVTIVCAAGNDADFVGQPARYDSVLAISAVNSNKEFAGFSNWGKQVDFAAGGVSVYSTYLNNGYAKLSGTSMSSPAVAGIVALILADEYKDRDKWLSPDEVTERLKKIAFDCGPQGFDEMYGNGIPMFKTGDEPVDGTEPVPEPPKEPQEPKKERKKDNKFCDLSLLFPAAKAFVDAAVQGSGNEMEIKGKNTDEMVKQGLKGLQDFLQRVEEVRTRQG